MTLGQKLKLLLKENNMTQEELAERLEVSRQAVGKWVNDRGIPEVNKLLQISNMFNVSLDYLLKEELELKEETGQAGTFHNEYYVSREMLDGYLLYGGQKIKRVVGGIVLILIANVFDSFEPKNFLTDMLYWITMTTGLCLFIWQYFSIKPYREIYRRHLILDEKVFEEFKRQRQSNRKRYLFMIIAGFIFMIAESELGDFLMISWENPVYERWEWIAAALWSGLIVGGIMLIQRDELIIKNAEQGPKNRRAGSYRWIYWAVPATVIAVIIGFTTNIWSPFFPVIVLFCGLLVTVCKLMLERRDKDE